MHQIELYELRTPRVVALQLKAGSEIRVVRGRLWLTLAGHADDVWLQAGEGWTLPASGSVWLSAEPAADFRIARCTATHRFSEHQGLVAMADFLRRLARGNLDVKVPGYKLGSHKEINNNDYIHFQLAAYELGGQTFVQ